MNRFVKGTVPTHGLGRPILTDRATGKPLVIAEDASHETERALDHLASVLNFLYGTDTGCLSMHNGRLEARSHDKVLAVDLNGLGSLYKLTSLMDERLQKADEVFSSYDFGKSVEVTDHQGWDTSEPNDFSKIVYIEPNDAGRADACTDRLSFHVCFTPGGTLIEAFALDLRSGAKVGTVPQGVLASLTVDPVPHRRDTDVLSAVELTNQSLLDVMQYLEQLEVIVGQIAQMNFSEDAPAPLCDLSRLARQILRA